VLLVSFNQSDAERRKLIIIVWSNDMEEAERIGSQIEAGTGEFPPI